MKQTLYDILGVPRDASFEDIEVAYATRFEVLKAETSWDSNRLVMLNEAREVLSDAARRAAYDASLDAPPRPVGARTQSRDIEEGSGSLAKWIIAIAILAAIVIWWAMRDDVTPVETVKQAAEEQGQAQPDSEETSVVVLQGGDVTDVADRETLSEIAAVEVPEDTAPEESTVTGAPETSAASAGGDVAEATSGTAPATGANSSIVGYWDCFEPVTGRSSEYGFTADGTLSIQPASGQLQSFSYEMADGRINLVGGDPPQSIDIEEFSSRKMILNSSVSGQRIVCSR